MKLKKKVTKFIIAVLCLSIVFAFAACGNGKANSNDKKNTDEADKKEAKKWVVATEPTYEPFEFTDEDGKIVGFDVELMEAIAKDQGYELEWSNLAFDSLTPALKAGNADLVIAGLTKTEKRAESVDFSDPYYQAGAGVMVKKDSEINDSKDLPKDLTVSTQIATSMASIAEKMKEKGEIKDVVLLDSITTSIMQLNNGDVDAVFADNIVIENYIADHSDEVKYIGLLPDQNDQETDICIAAKKGNSEILDKVNAGLKNVIDSGKYKELCEKWHLTPLY
jgi:ABC-type amino acid transport substrate-binding protein